MEAIKTFQITSMTISGFKSYQEPTELIFGNPTVITGGNGRGKSSIADAISFAVTGLPFFGERGIDRLHNECNPDLSIRMRFVGEKGDPHELIRTRRKNRMTIVYDGCEIRQLDLWDLFGERDVFLSILNPLYFIEELGESGKNLLERYLPMIPHEAVLAQLSEAVREELRDEQIMSPEAFLKKCREEIRALNDQIIYITGQKDHAGHHEQTQAQAAMALQHKTADLEAEVGVLEQKQFAGMDTSILREQLVELSQQYEEAARDCSNDTFERSERIHALRGKISVRQAEQYRSQFTSALAEANAKVQVLREQYEREAAAFRSFTPDCVCPTCHRVIPSNALPEVQEELKKAAAGILKQAREQAAQLQQLQELDRKSAETFEQFKADDIQKWSDEAEFLEAENTSGAGAEKLDEMRISIQQLTAELEYGKLTQTEYERLRLCREELRQCEAELAALRAVPVQEQVNFDNQIRRCREEISELEKRIAAAVLYIGKRAEMTLSQLKLNRVEISLFDVVKSTGEVKDTFKFTYSGRRYDRLSLSEKIRAGMEVSELIKRLTGRNYPVFVDNMESVDDLENVHPTGQLILAKCVSKAKLQVRPVTPVAAAQQRAA